MRLGRLAELAKFPSAARSGIKHKTAFGHARSRVERIFTPWSGFVFNTGELHRYQNMTETIT